MMSGITRRAFSAGLLAAGTAAATKASAFGAFAANGTIRAAVIGCRTRGRQLARRVLAAEGLSLAALCDCDAEVLDATVGQIRREYTLPPDLRTPRDFRAVLDDRSINAVFVATPDHWHAVMSIMALQAGKHVYLEKPASYNIDEGKAMVAAQRRFPRQIILIGTQQRSAPHFAEAKQFLDSGALGRIGFSRAWITQDSDILPRVPDTAPPDSLDYDLWLGPAPFRPYNQHRVHYNWHFMRDTGTGYMANWGAHWIDVIRWFLGIDLPEAVSGHGVKVVEDIKEWPDTHTVFYEYPGLTVLWEQRIWTGYRLNDKQCGVEFHGDHGAMFIDRHGWTFYPKEAGGKPINHEGTEDLMTDRHVAHFAACIRGDAEPVSSIDEGHRTAILCHLGNIAATVRRRIAFDTKSQTIRNDAEADGLTRRAGREPWKPPDL